MKKRTNRVLSLAPLESSGAPLLTEHDVARLLRISPRHAQRLAIPFVNVGTRSKKCKRFRPQDVAAWLQAQVQRA